MGVKPEPEPESEPEPGIQTFFLDRINRINRIFLGLDCTPYPVDHVNPVKKRLIQL